MVFGKDGNQTFCVHTVRLSGHDRAALRARHFQRSTGRSRHKHAWAQ
jgi:hypothetical protein